MNQFNLKLRLIFIPFLVVFAATLSAYSFLHWLLIIKLELFNLETDTVNVFIPAGFAIIPVVIWMRPRIKLLALIVKGKNDPIFSFLFLIWATIAVPLVLSQFLLVTATGQLTPLKPISEISQHSPTKYYTAKYHYAGKRFVHIRRFYTISGKGNIDFNMNIYVAIPLFNHIYPDTNIIARLRNQLNPQGLIIINGKLSDMKRLKSLPADSIQAMRYLNATMVMPMYGDKGKFGALAVATTRYKLKMAPPPKLSPSAWLAVKYQKTVSNRRSAAEKDSAINAFSKKTWAQFAATDFDQFVYLDRVPYGRDKDIFTEATNSLDDVAIGERIIVYPVFESFNKHNGSIMIWMFGAFALGSGIFLLCLIPTKLKAPAQYHYTSSPR